MAIENVRRFEEKINGDEALQARLKELSDAFDGDRQDPRAVFEAVVAPLATEVGLPYMYDEAVEYVDQRDDEDLTADEAKAVAGGKERGGDMVVCCIIGFGGVRADGCLEEFSGWGVCAGIGAGSLVL